MDFNGFQWVESSVANLQVANVLVRYHFFFNTFTRILTMFLFIKITGLGEGCDQTGKT